MEESRIPKELHRKIFELTLALYRVTDFFPQGEVLRRQLREKANEIFGSVIEYAVQDPEREAISILAKIEGLKGYLGLARSMHFVRPVNLRVLEREYLVLTDFFSKELESIQRPQKRREENQKVGYIRDEEKEAQLRVEERKDKKGDDERERLTTWHEFSIKPEQEIKQGNAMSPIETDINERQKVILEYLKRTSQAKISDFFSAFTGISSKTIQRDLQNLVAKNVLRKEGEKRWTTYFLNP